MERIIPCCDLLLIRHSSFVIRHSSFRGHDAAHPSFSRDRTDRVSLFIGRPRRCVGLHRDDDLVRNRANRYPSDGAGAEHSCSVNRHVSILACRALLVETVLAVCAAFHSGSVSRWLLAAFGFDSENSDRRCAAPFGGPTYGSPKRSAANVSPVATSGGERRRRSWVSCRTNRHGRRNFSDACPAFFSLGAYSTSRCRLGTVYLGELDCRPGRLLHKSPHHSFARLNFGSGSNYRRHHRFAFGKQAICCARNFALPRDRAADCWN